MENHTYQALEDHAGDVAGKALRGLGWKPEDLAGRIGVTLTAVREFIDGGTSPELARRLAEPLGLSAEALARAATGSWLPEPVRVPGLRQLALPFPFPTGGMFVNVYLVAAPGGSEAIVFDGGPVGGPIRAALEESGWNPRMLFFTHAHHDHVAGWTELAQWFPHLTAWHPPAEPVAGARSFESSREWSAGGLTISARPTPGHSPGGTTYLIRGLAAPVAITGDALFAGSIGGVGAAQFAAAKDAIRREILQLDPATVLCPGHGPMTTVGEELTHHPFFA